MHLISIFSPIARLHIIAGAVCSFALFSCVVQQEDSTVLFAARKIGVRAPLTADCDDTSPTRCLLPWPSNVFTRADASTETGIRLAIAKTGLTVRDDVDVVNQANGFSRGTPLLVGFDAEVVEVAESIRLFVAQADVETYGQSLPVETYFKNDAGQSIIGANPRAPLLANADYVAIVTRDLVIDADSPVLEPTRSTLLALELAEAENDTEKAWIAYHAPTRAVLQKANVSFADVLVVWEFTTRSKGDPTQALTAMIAQTQAAVAAGEVRAAVTQVSIDAETGAVSVLGRLSGVPYFRLDDGGLAPFRAATENESAKMTVTGVTNAPFRVLIPPGTGDYPASMYGHGTGGSYDDDALDSEMIALGLAKVSGEFRGWTGDSVLETWIGFESMFRGVHRSTAALMQSFADMAAIQAALNTVIGDVLAQSNWTFDNEEGIEVTVQNPAANRRPEPLLETWTGGSLGGTMGLAYVSAHPQMRYGVLNVPGAAWTQWIHDAYSYGLIATMHKERYGGSLDLMLAMKMSQTLFDPIDGVAWCDHLQEKNAVLLIQESIGDTILPNSGSRMVAACAKAVQIGGIIEPVVGIEEGIAPSTSSAYTQFRAPTAWEGLERHGFANKDGEVSEAARQQIRAYLTSVQADAPEIVIPALCQERGDVCDFSEP